MVVFAERSMGMMDGFRPYSPLHLVTVAICFVVMAAFAWLGRRWREHGPLRERRLRTGWVVVLVPFQLFAAVWWMLPAGFDIRAGLPLHICDLVVWAAPFALLAGWRWPRTILYFWGIGLSILAFVVPVLRRGPAEVHFWLFWVGHTQIVGSAAYVVAVLGYRPSRRDLGVAILATAAYTAVIVPVNVAFDLNYGYIGPRSEATGFLGPWPGRVVVILGLEILGFTLLYLPWRAGGSSRRAGHGRRGSP